VTPSQRMKCPSFILLGSDFIIHLPPLIGENEPLKFLHHIWQKVTKSVIYRCIVQKCKNDMKNIFLRRFNLSLQKLYWVIVGMCGGKLNPFEYIDCEIVVLEEIYFLSLSNRVSRVWLLSLNNFALYNIDRLYSLCGYFCNLFMCQFSKNSWSV